MKPPSRNPARRRESLFLRSITLTRDLHGYIRNARYYDPTVGRFLTEDPSKKGLNWYAYAGNDPVNRVDPMGLKYYDAGNGYSYNTDAGGILKNSDIPTSTGRGHSGSSSTVLSFPTQAPRDNLYRMELLAQLRALGVDTKARGLDKLSYAQLMHAVQPGNALSSRTWSKDVHWLVGSDIPTAVTEATKLVSGALAQLDRIPESANELFGHGATALEIAISGLKAVQVGRKYGTKAGVVEFSEALVSATLGAFEERAAYLETGSYVGSAELGTYVARQYYHFFQEILPPSSLRR